MNPLSIKARNYRTFAELDLDLPTGCVAIVGENGAGKSSIVNVIDLALFGPESRTLADALSDDTVDENLILELTFEHAGETYRVRRTYSARGRGQTKVDFERHDVDDFYLGEIGPNGEDDLRMKWLPLTRETAAATQDAITQCIGLTRETFRASAFLAQGDGAAFTEAQPRDRKRILCDVLGLSVWDRLLDCARRDRRGAEDELVRVDNSIAFADQELTGRLDLERQRAEARVNRDAAVERIETTEAELAKANELLAKARAMNTARVSAERALEGARQAQGAAMVREAGLRQELEQLHERLSARDGLVEVSGQLPVLEAERDRLQQRTQQADERARLVGERNRVAAQIADLDERRNRIADHIEAIEHQVVDSCDRCGQTLAADARAKAIASHRGEIEQLTRQSQELDAQRAQLTAQIDQMSAEPPPTRDEVAILNDRIQRAQNARVQVAALDEAATHEAGLRSQLEECRETTPTLEAAVKTAQDELRALLPADGELPLPEIEDEARDLNAALIGWRDTLQDATATLAKCDDRLERLNKITEERTSHQQRRSELLREIDILVTLERAYGKDGIPALIVENAALPQIEVEANRILTELGTPYRVELRTERALKSGDGVRDTLDVIVLGDAGERACETFSGGERTRINLALRIALARLLAHRRGAESRLLAIDEPEYLDEPGTAKLAEVLRGLAQSGDFDRVYLVSHVPGLRDAFDQTLTVVKDGTRSRIEGAKYSQNHSEPVLA